MISACPGQKLPTILFQLVALTLGAKMADASGKLKSRTIERLSLRPNLATQVFRCVDTRDLRLDVKSPGENSQHRDQCSADTAPGARDDQVAEHRVGGRHSPLSCSRPRQTV